MEQLGLFLIFWYGILHAFGPDHLTAIADFSIGKNKRKTMLITTLFAVGHGITLFAFAKLLESVALPESVTAYGDIISSSVIIAIGAYLLYMATSNKIHLKTHVHDGKSHTHIWFGKEHEHDKGNGDVTSAFTIGALMGMGGVRGMLVTLGMLEGQAVELTMIFAFILGVMVIFVGFGMVILFINQNVLTDRKNVRRVFGSAGAISIAVGSNMLLG